MKNNLYDFVIDLEFKGGIPNKNLKITTLSFLYKEMIVTVKSDTESRKLINEFEKVSESVVRKDVEFFLEQLDIIREEFLSTGHLTDKYLYVFYWDVYWLTKIGVLPNDEHNGMIISFE